VGLALDVGCRLDANFVALIMVFSDDGIGTQHAARKQRYSYYQRIDSARYRHVLKAYNPSSLSA
jgi:hypothetical protein